MITNKSIELIKTFSEEEFSRFGLFLGSPYFNKEKIQVKLYVVLKKHYPDFDSRKFVKEKVFAKLYPGKKYNDGVLRNILSRTLQLAEKFLEIQKLQENKFRSRLSLMKELGDRKMEGLFEKVETETKQILDERPVKDDSYYYDNYLLLAQLHENKIKHKSSLYSSEQFLSEMTESLAVYFMINVLRTGTHLANMNVRMFRFDENLILANELELYLDKEFGNYKDITYVMYYYNAFKLAKTGNEKFFYALRSIAKSDYDKLTPNEKKNIFTLLTNYCYYKINKGELKFRKEQFLIYKESVERGVYKGDMSFFNHILYLNVVITGIEAGEIEWVENFIEKYKNELDIVNMDNTYNFSRALVYYHQKEFDSSIIWASKVKTDDLSYKHQLKSLYLKIYFDMNDSEPFYSHIDSYKHFLQNERNISEQMKEALSSYINFSKKLFDIINSNADKDFELDRLKRQINESRATLNKAWLLAKIEENERVY